MVNWDFGIRILLIMCCCVTLLPSASSIFVFHWFFIQQLGLETQNTHCVVHRTASKYVRIHQFVHERHDHVNRLPARNTAVKLLMMKMNSMRIANLCQWLRPVMAFVKAKLIVCGKTSTQPNPAPFTVPWYAGGACGG